MPTPRCSPSRRLDERVEWIHGRAEALPLPDASVDAVISQFGLMFFDDRVAALREMQRVLRPSGYLAVAVCDAVERSPGYGALAGLLQSLFGDRLAAAFRAPFAIGDAKLLAGLAQQAGLQRAEVLSRSATVRFASIDALGVDRARLHLDARRPARRCAVRAPVARKPGVRWHLSCSATAAWRSRCRRWSSPRTKADSTDEAFIRDHQRCSALEAQDAPIAAVGHHVKPAVWALAAHRGCVPSSFPAGVPRRPLWRPSIVRRTSASARSAPINRLPFQSG